MVEQLIPMGLLIVVIGLVILVTGIILTVNKSKTKVEWAFGGFIGPVPFGFASRKEFLYLIIAISIVMLIIFLIINRRLIF